MTASRLGWTAFVLFLASVPFANWLIGHVGTVCVPGGPCLVPVAPGLLAPSGVLAAGAALVLRDAVQRCLGARAALAAVIAGTLLSVGVAPGALVLASGTAFLVSELADFAVYTPLQRRSPVGPKAGPTLLLAVVASSAVGLVVDSVVFLGLAFGSFDYLAGQVVGKAWAVLFALPAIRLLRRVAPVPA